MPDSTRVLNAARAVTELLTINSGCATSQSVADRIDETNRTISNLRWQLAAYDREADLEQRQADLAKQPAPKRGDKRWHENSRSAVLEALGPPNSEGDVLCFVHTESGVRRFPYERLKTEAFLMLDVLPAGEQEPSWVHRLCPDCDIPLVEEAFCIRCGNKW